MDQTTPFRYRPSCSARECDRPAVYKIAATWSDGSSRELKTYGLACEAHLQSCLAAARGRHIALGLADGESVGPIEIYELRPGCRDAELVACTSFQPGHAAPRGNGLQDDAEGHREKGPVQYCSARDLRRAKSK
jgi:hypothetical protein